MLFTPKPSNFVDICHTLGCYLLELPMALRYEASAMFLLLKQFIKHWASRWLTFMFCAPSFLIFSKLMHSTAHSSYIEELNASRVALDD